MMKPVVHGLEEEYSDDIEFVYINIDDPESLPLKEQYGFRVQPHFLLVDANGEIVNQWLGSNAGEVFETAFDEVIN